MKSTSTVCCTCFKKKRDMIKNLDWIFKSTESDEVNLCLWSLRLFLITEEDCDFHPAAIFPPHVQNVLFLTVVSLFFSPLSTDRCSFRRSSSFVCLRHGRRTTEALCRTSIRSATPALNFRWDSTIPLNAEFRIRCNLCLKKKQLVRLIRIACSRFFVLNTVCDVSRPLSVNGFFWSVRQKV